MSTQPTGLDEHGERVGRGRHGWLAGIGIGLILAGPVGYVLLVGQPMLRSTGLPAWIGIGLGLGAAGLAWRRDSRKRVKAMGVSAVALAAIWTYAFYGFARMPESAIADRLALAPGFELADQTGRSVSLEGLLKKGRVLLVFYRGHW